ncbi:MAG: hypothetical protein CSA22_00365 [Deltaproteobacteria bacterium]|nr:MAG: hypothetical protein CSA22_00365 [Deltaproteobacteria bacterium]
MFFPRIPRHIVFRPASALSLFWRIARPMVICFGIAAMGYMALPPVVNRWILPEINTRLTGVRIDTRVTHLSPFEIRMAETQVHLDLLPDPVTLTGVRIRFSPRSLTNGRVRGITLTGLRVPVPKTLPQPSPSASHPSAAPSLAELAQTLTRLGTLQVTESCLCLPAAWTHGKTGHQIPFSLTAAPTEADTTPYHAELTLHLRSAACRLTAALDQTPDALRLWFELPETSPLMFADMMPELLPYLPAGITAEGSLTLSPDTMTLTAAHIRAWADVSAPAPLAARIRVSHREATAENSQIELDITHEKGQAWQLTAAPFTLGFTDFAIPPVDCEQFTCSVAPDTRPITVDMAYQLRSPLPGPRDGISRLTATGTIRGSIDPASGDWQLSSRPNLSAGTGHIHLSGGGYDLSTPCPDCRITVRGNRDSAAIDARLKTGPVKMSSPGVTVSATSTDIRMTGSKNPDLAALDVTAATTGPGLVTAPGSVSFADIRLKTQMTVKPETGICLTGVFTGDKGTLCAEDLPLKLSGITARLPFAWPVRKSADLGTIALPDIRFQGKSVASAAIGYRLIDDNATLSATLQTPLIPALTASVTGVVTGPSAALSATIDWTTSAPFDLSQLHPALTNMTWEGGIHTSASAQLSPDGVTGTATCTLDAGRFTSPQVTAAGISGAITFPELPEPFTLPDQQIQVSEITAGRLHLKQGSVCFCLESPTSLFIERAAVKWCGGTVETAALRLDPAIVKYASTLYCDRLNLSELLGQLGVGDAQGKGTVSGKIPFRFTKTQIRFDDGFLYSSPGEGGTLRMNASETLRLGGGDMAGVSQIDLATEALKQYDYKWVKLRIHSEADDRLRVKLQFDGKPATPLPFVFKPEAGGFVRVPSGNSGSVFQGISLDINFRLPLEEILHYQGLMKTLE